MAADGKPEWDLVQSLNEGCQVCGALKCVLRNGRMSLTAMECL